MHVARASSGRGSSAARRSGGYRRAPECQGAISGRYGGRPRCTLFLSNRYSRRVAIVCFRDNYIANFDETASAGLRFPREKMRPRKTKTSRRQEYAERFQCCRATVLHGADVAAKMDLGRTMFRSTPRLWRADVASKFTRRCGGIVRPTSLFFFRIMIVAPTPGGGLCHGYVDVAPPRDEYRASIVAASPLCRGVAPCDKLGCISGDENGAPWYSDNASVYRSGEMESGVLFETSKNAPNVPRSYRARYCGNAVLNRYFARGGEQITLFLVGRWP